MHSYCSGNGALGWPWSLSTSSSTTAGSATAEAAPASEAPEAPSTQPAAGAATSPSRSNSRRRRTALESRGSSAYGRLFTADELTSLRPYAARGPAFVAVPQASASGPPSVCSCCVPRARTCVAFGVECLVNCEDDVAVFERGSGCVDGLLLKAEGMSPMMLRGRSRWRVRQSTRRTCGCRTRSG